jgi:hypothetical protein
MDSAILVAILGTGGMSAIVGAIITGAFSKRKLGAEATEIITKAAAGVVTNLEAEITRQKSLNEELVSDHRSHIERLMASHAEEIREFRRVLQLHVAWDAIAIAEMAKVGIKLPPAPPLLPARSFDHPEEV